MIAADTSVVVAAFASWHEAHDAARRALKGEVNLPAHVWIESYSVLTRLPPPHRAQAALVEAYLSKRFPLPPLTLSPEEYRAFLRHAVRTEISGGAIYDALVAATAQRAGLPLLTRDARAVTTYERLSIDYRFVD